ncbi:hypothetical protein [Ligilactobacillus murinus]|uniref:hypothetical protein n=1 Tax=Ligilactobacillus murinus TaxID=1622 RepID=UPI001094AACF|nr:hypothetical protein [Ligilactobacillus murinus]TGY52909.1 hypothetical protein E5341_04595 [Ligilactobacillus murinus]
MLSQSDETIAAWKATERTLAVRITIAGKEYTATDINSLKYDAGAYTGETFAIGSTYSNNVQIEFSHLVEGLNLGDEVQVSVGINVSGNYVYEPLGVFIISSEIKMDRNNNLTTISASDAFCKLEGVYKSKLIYPANLLDVISEICAMAGAEPNTSELSRLPKLADIPTAIEGQSYRKALGWIAQLYAGYATFDRSGKLTIRTVAEPSYELDPSQYEQSGLTKNEATYKIGGIQCQVTTKSTTRDDQVQETTTTLQVGSTSGSQIKLENNIMTPERLDYIWEKLKDINFYPFSLNWFGNPAVEAGDWLRLYDKKGNDFVVPNNGYTLEFNGGLSAVSKADQTSGSAQTISWSGSIMQIIKDLQHRNAPDGTVIFPTSISEPPENAHFNDVWFKKNGNDTELWIFERQDNGTGEWQRKDIVNDKIKAEIEKQQAKLEKLSKNIDDSTESFQQSLSGIYDAVENAKINTDKAVQQALDQAQKASNDLLNYASEFDSEINLLNEAKDKNKADINKLLTDVNGVKGMYADLEGNISNFSAGLNGLSGQLKDTKNQLASVKLTADGAVSNFANLQGDIASLKTRANGIEQQMLSKVGSDVFESFKSSAARELKEKLTATDLNGYVKTAELERTANGLHASVTAVEGKINGLTLGGRNYLQGTADFTWPNGVGDLNSPTKVIENYNGNIKMLHISNSGWGGFYTRWGDAFPNGQLQVGDDYTISFDAKGRGTFEVVKNESEAGNGPLSGVNLTNDWKRYSVSGKINDLNKAFVIYFRAGYDAYIKCVKIEKSNKATDWSPAPEDLDKEFSTVNNTLKSHKATLDILKDGISLNAVETSKINDKISNLGVQNLVYNSEFINDAEGWSNIGNNPAGTILFANNEWDSWKGSNGLAFRNPSKQDYLVSDNKRFKVVSGQRLSASVQLHVTALITHGQCRAGMEIKFYANEKDSEIATSNQQTQFMYNIENGQQKLLYCENVEVPSNANYAAIRLYTFGVGNIIFNQPMVTFSSERLPYIKDNKLIGSLQDKYAVLDVKVNGINATVVNKADVSYVDQKANQLQLALTNLSVGGTNLLGGTSTEARSNDAPTSGWVEGAVYNTTQPLNENQYILSFEARGDVNGQRIGTFLWHGGLGGRNISKKSTTSLGENFTASDGQTFVTLTNQWKRYWVLYDVDPDNTKKTAIVGRRWVDSKPSGKVYVRKIKLEAGNKATSWSPAPEDDMAAITAVRNELNTAINLRVQKNELLSQINLQAGRTLIQSNKIYLDAESVVFSGKAFIPSAAIASLSADKINGGTINGRTVNVTNLNANNITSGTINGQNLSINLDNGVVDFQKGRIRSTTGTLDINIDNGSLKIADFWGNGIFSQNGSIDFSTRSIWDEGKSPKYGRISRFSQLLSEACDGMQIVGNEGLLLKTSNYNGWGYTVNDRVAGSAVTLGKNGKMLVEAGGPISFVSGILDSGMVSSRPHIVIGTDKWHSWGEITNVGSNIYVHSNGLYLSITGETLIGGGGLTVQGRLGVQGAKNSIVDTSQGKTAINAYETAEYYFGDIAKANTGTSKRVKIMIDPLFLETINTDIDYHVFVSSYSNGYAWVSEMARDYFVIESNVPNLSVSYEIKAKRKQYENVRLDKVDVNLTGGTK